MNQDKKFLDMMHLQAAYANRLEQLNISLEKFFKKK